MNDMPMTSHQLGKKRSRKALRRQRILEARMRAYGEKSVPRTFRIGKTKNVIPYIESKKLNLWQRLKAWLKNLI